MSKTIQSCLSSEVLEQIERNEVSPDELIAIEEHVSECSRCREVFESHYTSSQWSELIQPALSEAQVVLTSVTEDGADHSAAIVKLLGPTDDPNMLGRIGNYEIVGVIGQGGMGAVFKGFDRSLNRFVAIKMLLPHLAASGAARKRFAREGQAVAAVVDDHVMAIHCVDQWQGIPYLVMTYSRGVSLQKRLNDSGPLELREILRIGMQAAKGLAAAHSQGIVHRDIKPSNMLLDQNVERVQLVDFGLARAADDASLTCSGTLAGTPQYMSPEQARAETVDHRSDLFSLGSVLYAMCAGYAPFRADSSYSVLRLIIEKEPRSIREINSDIPEWLCAIIGKLMAKQAVDRFDSAKQVAELLEGCLAHVQQPTTVPLPSSVAELASLGSSTSGGNQAQTVRNGDLKEKTWRRLIGPPFGKHLAAALAAAAMILAGVVIVLELNKGTLTIKSVANDVPIRIVQGKDTVQELTVSMQGTTTRLRAGTYTVEIAGNSTAYEIQGDNVTVKRGEETLVNISIENVTAGTTSSDHSTGKAKPKVDASKANPSISTSSKVVPQSDSLEGVWEGFYYGEGEVLADDKRLRIVVTNGKLAALTGKRLLWISDYTLESQYVPKRISYEFDGKPMRGIYEVKEDGLRLNTAELTDDLPAKFATNYPEFKRLEGARAREFVEIVLSAARELGDDPLSHAIDQFNNRMLNTFLFHGQPPLTKDELVACASWKLEPDNESSETLKAGLTKIAQLHQLPDNWTIEGNSYVNDDPVPIHVFENYLQTDLPNERFMIRRRFLRPSNDYSPSPATKDQGGGTSLASAVEQFNAHNAHFSGRMHPPLTEDEVVAAIFHYQTMRDKYAAIESGDWLIDRLQDIARTRQLPEGATIIGKSSFEGENGNKYTTLTIGIAIVGDKKHEGLTHMFEIRQQFISVDRKNGFPMPNTSEEIFFPKEFHGSWRIRDAMTLTTKRPDYIDEVVVIDDNSLLLTAGESSNRYRLSYWKHRDDNQSIEVDLTAKSPDGNESKTFRCLMEIQGDVLTLLRQQNEHFPRPKSIDDISTSITRFTLVREKSGDKPTVYSPLEAIEIAKRFANDDHGSAITVKFRVASVHPPFVPTDEDKRGHTKSELHLDFRPLPANFKDDQFLVVLTQEAIAQLNKLGISDIEKHFLNKEVEAQGRVLSTMYTARGMPGDHFHLIVSDLLQIAFTKEQAAPLINLPNAADRSASQQTLPTKDNGIRPMAGKPNGQAASKPNDWLTSLRVIEDGKLVEENGVIKQITNRILDSTAHELGAHRLWEGVELTIQLNRSQESTDKPHSILQQVLANNVKTMQVQVYGDQQQIIDNQLPDQIRQAGIWSLVGPIPRWIQVGYGKLDMSPSERMKLSEILFQSREQGLGIETDEKFLTYIEYPPNTLIEHSAANSMCLFEFLKETRGLPAILDFGKAIQSNQACTNALITHLQFGSAAQLRDKFEQWMFDIRSSKESDVTVANSEPSIPGSEPPTVVFPEKIRGQWSIQNAYRSSFALPFYDDQRVDIDNHHLSIRTHGTAYRYRISHWRPLSKDIFEVDLMATPLIGIGADTYSCLMMIWEDRIWLCRPQSPRNPRPQSGDLDSGLSDVSETVFAMRRAQPNQPATKHPANFEQDTNVKDLP